ncbi:PE domain-containing protein [Streptoalloteichus hindustanus]|uniref:PE family protein n=1 Tax=Streptoalloteichus hindustanus TaxID=2017 RepID=A0A1M4XPB0_STRHI|nr:PE domain-containing protein [Streptoalloteichus hindustanus]SHE95103.1 PE family protein [Streptoalloteichus hindustanus]
MGEMVSGFWSAAGDAVARAGATIAGQAANAARAVNSGAGGGGGAAGNHFAVQADKIPDLIAELRHAKDNLADAAELAQSSAKIAPMGMDPFSPSAAERMGPKLVNNYLAANRRQQEDIQRMIDSLEAAKKTYENTEAANSAALRKQS